MKSNDSLTKLLKTWQPKDPSFSVERFIADTMRQIRLHSQRSFPRTWIQLIMDEWLPSPNILMPIAASVILFLAIFHWNGIVQQTKNMTASQWYEELSRPMAKSSLTGAYTQLRKE